MWSRMSLTASVLGTTGMVPAVCGESLVETQPSYVLPSGTAGEWSLSDFRHSGVVLQPAAVALNTKPFVAAFPWVLP